jgi:AraC-like DNA-binding protein
MTGIDAGCADPRPPREWARWHANEHGVELLEAAFDTHVYERHIHETYAIGVTLRGVQRFWCRGATRDSTAGDVMAINPGEAHDGRSGAAGGYAYRMIYVPAESLRAIADDALEHPGKEVYVSAPILKDATLAAQLCAAWDSLAHPGPRFAGDALLYEALLGLAMRHAGVRPACGRTVDAGALRRVKDCLHSRVEDGIRVQELADLAGMSRFQLTRQFQRVFGLPLHAYHLHLKLEEAKRRLRNGTPIVRIASELGFTDQSHLNRRFKGAFGMTPNTLRRSWAAGVAYRSSHADPRRKGSLRK